MVTVNIVVETVRTRVHIVCNVYSLRGEVSRKSVIFLATMLRSFDISSKVRNCVVLHLATCGHVCSAIPCLTSFGHMLRIL